MCPAFVGYPWTVEPTAFPASVDELYARFGRPAWALARRVLADEVLAEDVLQDVMVDLWRNAGAFDPARGSLSSWVMAMVHHKAVDAVRREQSQRDRHARAADRAADRTVPVPRDVVDAACERLDATRVRRALADLPHAQRTALALAYFDGFTQTEIAGLTDTPLGTVKTRMRTGMAKLRTALTDLALEPLATPAVSAS